MAVDRAAAKRYARAAMLLKLGGDVTRIHVLKSVAAGEKNVGEMTAELGVAQPSLSHHLALMRMAALVRSRRSGKNNYYSLAPAGEILVRAVDAIMAAGPG